jgi:hypothetical protein
VAQCRAPDCKFNWQIEAVKPTLRQKIEALNGLTLSRVAPLVFQNRSDTVFLMNKTVIEVQVRAVLPTSGGCAVFLGNAD